MKQKTFVLLVLGLLFLPSCKSLIDYGGVCSIPGPKRVYGGTRMTFEMYEEESAFRESEDAVALAVFNLYDFPLCLAMDTILLPWTLHWNLFYTEEERKKMNGEQYRRNKEARRKRREQDKLRAREEDYELSTPPAPNLE